MRGGIRAHAGTLTMNRAQEFRLFRLYKLLMAQRGIKKCRELADELEMSTKTVYRDIEYLRNAGVVIRGYRNKGASEGGYWLVKDKCPCCGK